VSGIRLCDRIGTGGKGVADQQPTAVGTPEVPRVEAELRGEWFVEHKQRGRGRGLGFPADGHLRKLTGKAVPEGE
jgi:hypothetical protein